MADDGTYAADGGRMTGRMGSGLFVVGVAMAVLIAVVPAFGDTPESGPDPSVTLTVTPDDQLANGQTVTVTGTGFPPNSAGVIRQCGGSAAAPQCEPGIAAAFLTTSAGDIPPTSVTVERIVDTGTTTFNCGVQQCFLVATAGGRTAQHHISILGAGTVVPTSTSSTSTSTTVTSSTSTSSTSTSTSTSSTTTTLPATAFDQVCRVLRALLVPFPFLGQLVGSLLAVLRCAPVG